MNLPFWEPFGWFWQLGWLLIFPIVVLFAGLIYLLDWISGSRRWGTWILNRIGA